MKTLLVLAGPTRTASSLSRPSKGSSENIINSERLTKLPPSGHVSCLFDTAAQKKGHTFLGGPDNMESIKELVGAILGQCIGGRLSSLLFIMHPDPN